MWEVHRTNVAREGQAQGHHDKMARTKTNLKQQETRKITRLCCLYFVWLLKLITLRLEDKIIYIDVRTCKKVFFLRVLSSKELLGYYLSVHWFKGKYSEPLTLNHYSFYLYFIVILIKSKYILMKLLMSLVKNVATTVKWPM